MTIINIFTNPKAIEALPQVFKSKPDYTEKRKALAKALGLTMQIGHQMTRVSFSLSRKNVSLPTSQGRLITRPVYYDPKRHGFDREGLSRCPRFRWHAASLRRIMEHGPAIRLPDRIPASVSGRGELRALPVRAALA